MTNKEIPQWAREFDLDIEKTEYEFEGVKYPLEYDNEEQERFFVDSKIGEKRYLIESQQQIDSRLENDYYDFSYRIFTCEAYFDEVEFTGKADFTEARFERESVFDTAKFIDSVNFFAAIFINRTSFFKVKFAQEAIFSWAEFNMDAYFGGGEFNWRADFMCSEFKENVDFYKSQFIGKANFDESQFTKNATFRGVEFMGPISFKFAKFESRFILDEVNKDDENKLDFSKFELDLTSTIADDISYSNHNITKVADRNTWLTLKQAAIKQNDHISALEFHKKEMEQYKQDLKKSSENSKKNRILKLFNGARLILLFEQWVSDFGTNALRSVLWIILITLFFEASLFWYLYINYDAQQFNISWASFINSYLYSLNPIKHINDILSPYMTSKTPSDLINNSFGIALFGVANFIKNIVVGVLIYETIKSFRRFSRKL